MTPTEDTLSVKSLEQVAEVVFFNSIFTPLVSHLEPLVWFRQRVHAPYTPNYAKMKSFFAPRVVDLGGSYASNNQSLFIGMFYITLLPTSLALSCFGLVLQFYTDKQGLLRRWARLPEMGATLITTSVSQMMFTIVVSLVMANRYYGGWPFDKACAPASNSSAYTFCNRGNNELLYNKHDRDKWYPYWDSDQQWTVGVCGWTAAGFMGAVGAYYVFWASAVGVRALIWGTIDDHGHTSEIKFTQVDEIQAYVPQIGYRGLETPLLACDISVS
jgi:hypothetical protein